MQLFSFWVLWFVHFWFWLKWHAHFLDNHLQLILHKDRRELVLKIPWKIQGYAKSPAVSQNSLSTSPTSTPPRPPSLQRRKLNQPTNPSPPPHTPPPPPLRSSPNPTKEPKQDLFLSFSIFISMYIHTTNLCHIEHLLVTLSIIAFHSKHYYLLTFKSKFTLSIYYFPLWNWYFIILL